MMDYSEERHATPEYLEELLQRIAKEVDPFFIKHGLAKRPFLEDLEIYKTSQKILEMWNPDEETLAL